MKYFKPPLYSIVADGFNVSKSEARRLIAQGAVKLRYEEITYTVDNPNANIQAVDGLVIQVGKKRFLRLRIEGKR